MRILCDSIEKFLSNLRSAKGPCWLSTVWIDRTSNVLEGSITTSVYIQAQCVVNSPDGSQYIIQGGEDCGEDFEDGDEEKFGSEKQAKLYRELQDYCESAGLSVQPGILEV